MYYITVSDPEDLHQLDEQHAITSSHFGINFVANYERIGSKPWEKFDEIVDVLQPETVRYPGGIFAEEGFDITNPNASEILLSDGSTQAVMGAYDFAEFAAAQGVRATFIVPTKQLLIPAPNNPNKLIFDSTMAPYVTTFVESVLISSAGEIETFEIGNEYESYMDSAEYGLLVNQLAPLIQDAIDNYKSINNLESDWQEPKIAAQVWSWIAQDHSSMDANDLMARASTQFTQLSHGALDAIDALTTHWYAKDRSGGYESTYQDLEENIENSINVLSAWDEFSPNPVEIIVSEWAANFHERTFWGMAQVPIGIKMFAEFVQAGVDEMNFWSAQYHGISLALPNGELTAMGVVLGYLNENAVGHSAIDLNTGMASVGGVAFLDNDGGTIFLSNLSNATLTYKFSLENLGAPYEIVAVGALGVDETSADGKYRSISGLESYNEPDLAGTLTWSLPSEDLTSVNLSAFDTVIFKVTKTPEPSGETDKIVLVGTPEADEFIFHQGIKGATIENFDPSQDTLNFRDYTAGITKVHTKLGSMCGGRIMDYSGPSSEEETGSGSLFLEIRQDGDDVLVVEVRENHTSQLNTDNLLVRIADTQLEELALTDFWF